jgi:hypothetical protein
VDIIKEIAELTEYIVDAYIIYIVIFIISQHVASQHGRIGRLIRCVLVFHMGFYRELPCEGSRNLDIRRVFCAQ